MGRNWLLGRGGSERSWHEGDFRSSFRMPAIGQLIRSLDCTAALLVACAVVIGLCHRVRRLTNAIWSLGLYLGCSSCSSENKIKAGLYLVAHACYPIDVKD